MAGFTCSLIRPAYKLGFVIFLVAFRTFAKLRDVNAAGAFGDLDGILPAMAPCALDGGVLSFQRELRGRVIERCIFRIFPPRFNVARSAGRRSVPPGKLSEVRILVAVIAEGELHNVETVRHQSPFCRRAFRRGVTLFALEARVLSAEREPCLGVVEVPRTPLGPARCCVAALAWLRKFARMRIAMAEAASGKVDAFVLDGRS
jgi:hypothetical protein